MIVLPPLFMVFCMECHQTPFKLHQFVAEYAIANGADPLLNDCCLILDWCIAACHHNTMVTTSVLAIRMHAASVDDGALLECCVDDWNICLALPIRHPNPNLFHLRSPKLSPTQGPYMGTT